MTGPADGGEAVIRARSLVRDFGSLRAVDDVDLEIHRGEVFGFLGPNGAGKSTLLRMLVGVMAPTSGTVRVLDREVPRQADALRSRVGYMTQRFSLYEDLTVHENLDFAAEVFGLRRGERRERVEGTLATYGLERRRGQLAGTLSGGWKQRLSLAVATVHRPEILVLDEPTAGVDPAERRHFWERIFDLAGDGVTVLVSTHYMDEAVRCHRLAMLRRGRLVALGEPRHLTAALAGRVVEVEADPPEDAVALLRRRPEVASVTQLGDRVHVLLEADGPGDREAAPALAAHLAAAGLAGAAAEPARPGLEDVFVDSTLDDGDETGAERAAPPGAPRQRPTPAGAAPPPAPGAAP